MTTSPLRLRPADTRDLYCLWLWANDPETRRGSYARPAIPWRDHVAWFERQLKDHAYVLIGETSEAQPIGSARFDTTDGWRTARVSYVVAPEARKQGWSRPLVARGVELLRAERSGVTIIARVMADNIASVRLFRGLGWPESIDDGDHLFVQPSSHAPI